MPTYEYRCLDCNHEFEKFQSMKDDALKECPDCDGNVKRLIGRGAGIIFKGTGFYETDYKRSSSGGNDSGGNSDSKKSSDTNAKAS